MTDEDYKQAITIFLFSIFLIIVSASAGVAFCSSSWMEYHNQICIKYNIAEYNKTTGKFQMKPLIEAPE